MRAEKHTWDHGTVTQIPRNSLIMLMACQAMVILPHAAHISFWIIGVGLFCAWWRWMIFLGRKIFPSFWLKTALVLSSVAGVLISEGVSKNLETWAALLIVAFALKLLEMKTRRDAYVVIFIAYFVISVQFIFNHSMGIVAYELLALVLATAAMVGMNQFHTRVNPKQSIKIAAQILLQAIPLMVVVFVLFPRISPIWSIASPSQQARTGLSSEMTPGDIANLARSDEIVFRAEFEEEIPGNEELYWRGRVYSNFRLGTWSEETIPENKYDTASVEWVNAERKKWFSPKTNDLSKISYSILLEPTFDRWLFGLDVAKPKTSSTGLLWNYRLVSKKTVQSLLQYEVDSFPNAKMNLSLPKFLKKQTTTINKKDNPKTIKFARELYKRSKNTEDYANKVLAHIRKQEYFYTLEPPTLARKNSIDEFWFDTRAGFCTHYAGAFVYMMRAAGIPARMVGGYQGGEINPVTRHVVVRQYQAHAWTEIWLPKKGWQRFDPTAAVAPTRISSGLAAALSENDVSSLSAFTNLRLNKSLGIQKLMFMFESLEHRWNLFVIGYGTEMQTDFLEKILGKITAAKIALVLLLAAVLSIAFVSLSLLKNNRMKNTHPVIKILHSFLHKLSRQGWVRQQHESVKQFITRAATERGLSEKEYASTITLVERLLYNPPTQTTNTQLQVVKKSLHTLQKKMASATS